MEGGIGLGFGVGNVKEGWNGTGRDGSSSLSTGKELGPHFWSTTSPQSFQFPLSRSSMLTSIMSASQSQSQSQSSFTCILKSIALDVSDAISDGYLPLSQPLLLSCMWRNPRPRESEKEIDGYNTRHVAETASHGLIRLHLGHCPEHLNPATFPSFRIRTCKGVEWRLDVFVEMLIKQLLDAKACRLPLRHWLRAPRKLTLTSSVTRR